MDGAEIFRSIMLMLGAGFGVKALDMAGKAWAKRQIDQSKVVDKELSELGRFREEQRQRTAALETKFNELLAKYFILQGSYDTINRDHEALKVKYTSLEIKYDESEAERKQLLARVAFLERERRQED